MTLLQTSPFTLSPSAHSRPIAEAPIGPGRHIYALDGIRGLAVLMVLVFHIFQAEPAPRQFLLRLGYAATRFGQTGVDLFFVLSGFLITGILFDTKMSRRYFVNFYGRRTLRIFPLYYGVLIALLVLAPRVFGIEVPSVPPIWLWTFSTNFALIAGADGGHLGHFWTLAIEEQFYLVWPIAVYALSHTALVRVCLISLGIAAAVRVLVESQGISSFMFTFGRIDTLLLGALLALVARSPSGLIEWSRKAVVVGLIALAVAFPLCLTMRGSGAIWLQAVKYPVIATFYGALLVIGVTASPTSWTGWLLTLNPLRTLGKYSYGIYVFHPPLIAVISRLFKEASVLPMIADVHATAIVACKVALIFATSFATAWLSWQLYEKRFLVLKRYFEYD